MKRFYVGIDISKGWFDTAIVDDQANVTQEAQRFDNTTKGINKMLKELEKKYDKQQVWICLEHTGNYGLLLCSILQLNEWTFTLVPAIEISKSLGLTRGKTDAIDALRIAEYAAIHRVRLKPSKLPSEHLMQLKNLLAYRAQLTKNKAAYTNSLKSYKVASQVVDLSFIQQDLTRKITQLKTDISNIDKQIERLIGSDEQLKKNYQLIKSVRGIGMVIAAIMLVHTCNFTTFDDPRKFNCYTGLAPFERSSGLYKGKTKTSHYRHKNLKVLLFNGANCAALYDPQLKKYYQRKTEEGKHHMTVINAIACKLIYRVFATVKRQQPYVILSQ